VTRNAKPPRHLTLIVALLTMIGPFTINTYLPSFPDIETEFNVTRILLSQSLAFYLLAFALCTLAWGPLSDRLGRRFVIITSLLLYLLASLGCAISSDFNHFLLARLLQGAAAGGGLAAGRAMLRDAHPPQDAQRALSRVMMLFAIAPAVAPIIGGWLHDAFGWRSVFYFLAVYSGTILLLNLLWIPETLDVTLRQSFHPIKVARVYGHTLVHHRFLSLVMMMTCYFGGMFLYIAGAPTVVFDFLHLGVNDFAMLFVPLVGGVIFGAWLSGQLAHRWHAERTVTLALTFMSVGAALNASQALLLPPQVITGIIPLMFYSVGVGIAMPVMTVLILDCFPNNRGAASAVQGAIQMLGNALIASMAVPFLGHRPDWLALGQLSLIGITLLLWHFIPVNPANISHTTHDPYR
jgi:DHA1 family bicyclomycin/chloramphenicol resistance-like MFS transporter